ncbi:MAG TPA: FkbM family methyltransferase [Thermoanaerobaculia bacterium]|nr:FkbM family methyltransferase [Thermoanaerobaculia bacterium]
MNARALLRRWAKPVLRVLLRTPLRRSLESFLLMLGHRFPHRLPGRGVIAEELVRLHAGTTVVARLWDGSRQVVPATREAFFHYLHGRAFREDEGLTRLLAAEVRAGDVFVDVGANLGYYSLPAARAGARVYAFEAQQALAELLIRSAALNGFDERLAVMWAAVSDRPDGFADFFLAADSSLLGVPSLLPHDWLRGGIVERVPVVTLDAWAQRNGVTRIDVVKIDVEGAESLVLRGMREVLKQCRPRLVVIEAWPETISFDSVTPGITHPAQGAARFAECRAMLAACGYTPRGITRDGTLAPLGVVTGVTNVAFVTNL